MPGLSGSAWASEEKLLLLSDRSTQVQAYDFNRKVIEFYGDFAQAVKDFCRSQGSEACDEKAKLTNWEAIATDAQGNIYILQENPVLVYKLSSDLGKVLGVVRPRFEDVFEANQQDLLSLEIEQNSLGEGMVLLGNGRILISKEKYPSYLIEFGKETSQAEKQSSLSLEFPQEAVDSGFENSIDIIDFRPISVWNFSSSSKCDISDLSVFQGQLYVLSEKCNLITVLSSLSRKSENVEPLRFIPLPRALSQVESLSMKGAQYFIGSDFSKFLLSKKQSLNVLEME